MFSSNTSQVSSDALFVEDVFSTWLYQGNGSTQTITNGIDLSGKGGLVWAKDRTLGNGHNLFDTARGANKRLISSATSAEQTLTDALTAFNSSGFSLGADSQGNINAVGSNYVSWTFRKQPKFFDVVTYTGNGVDGRTVAHNLGSVPGCIIVKNTGQAQGWAVYHRSLSPTQWLRLETTNAASTFPAWADTAPTATVFSVGNTANTNAAGNTYVAYLFAHNAGGFGLTGTDNVISCGSFTGNGSTSGPSITLGYEPQWILTKNATSSGWNWNMFDNMRGLPVGSGDLALQANLSNAESGALNWIDPTATGFNITSSNAQINESGSTILYIAIRRGPMKVPTDGTKVFSPITSNSVAGTANITGFPVDLQVSNARTGNNPNNFFSDRLRGASSTTTSTGVALNSTDTTAEDTSRNITRLWDNAGFQTSQYFAGSSMVYWNFRRAPGFFDEVCYTGNSVNGRTVTHNLGVAPELMIVKNRTDAENWAVYAAPLGASKALYLNQTFAAITDSGQGWWGYPGVNPTATVFTLGTDGTTNSTPRNYVAYLFASCPGVSKVGSYTGNGSGQTIDCGFTGGARFVMIKVVSATSGWGVWDTARGITTGDDPLLYLNSTAAETTAPGVSPASSGFALTTSFNGNGVSYIYLAIA